MPMCFRCGCFCNIYIYIYMYAQKSPVFLESRTDGPCSCKACAVKNKQGWFPLYTSCHLYILFVCRHMFVQLTCVSIRPSLRLDWIGLSFYTCVSIRPSLRLDRIRLSCYMCAIHLYVCVCVCSHPSLRPDRAVAVS